jgi:septal ring factor EnvC (AmiA/AmiB activator)
MSAFVIVLLITNELLTIYSRLTHQQQSSKSNHAKQTKLQLEQYTNSSKLRQKVYKMNLHLARITQTRIACNSELKRKSYDLNKIYFINVID